MIGVRQVVKFDGEVVSDSLQSMPVVSVDRVESFHEITSPLGEHKLEITIEFDRALVPRDLTR